MTTFACPTAADGAVVAAVGPPARRAAPRTRRRVPLTRLVRVELRKSFDTRSGRWLLASLGCAALLTAGAGRGRERAPLGGEVMHTNRPGTVTTGRAVSQTRYGGPEVLRLTEVPFPVPGAGEVLVRVHAASVNARDWHVMRGEPRVARLMDRTLFGRRGPRVAVRGTDFAGVVEAVGTDVSAWRPGDVVFGEGVGTFAERAIASADQVAAIPAGTTFEQAAALPLAAGTALLCLDETGLEAGGRVLINGASGGVGTFAVQAAKAMGLHVTAVVSTRNVELVESLGADEVVDYTKTDFTRSGRTWDAVVDLVGNHRLHELRSTVRAGGRLVLSGGGNSGEGRIFGPMKLLVGAMALARLQPFEVRAPQSAPTREMLERASGMVSAGQLLPVVDRVFSLEDAPAAIRRVETEHARGKVVITVA